MISRSPDRAEERNRRIGIAASHRIVAGVKVEGTNDRGSYTTPAWLPGFLIRHNSRASAKTDSALPIDYDAMATLGCSREKADAALKLGRNTPVGSLPMSLDFVLVGDAVPNPEANERTPWLYPGLFDGNLVLYFGGSTAKNPFPFQFDEAWAAHIKAGGKEPRKTALCTGNGETARRLQPDETYRMVPCVPRGSSDTEAACPFSKGKFCKPDIDLCVILTVKDEHGNVAPLNRNPTARFAFGTGSINNFVAMKDELDKAATQLGGRINGLVGSLVLRMQQKITPEQKASIVPQISIHLDPLMIADRVARLRGDRPLLGGPVATVAPERLLAAPAAKAEPASKPMVHKDTAEDAEIRPRDIGPDDYEEPEFSPDDDPPPAPAPPPPAPKPEPPKVALPLELAELSADEMLEAAAKCTAIRAKQLGVDVERVEADEWWVEGAKGRSALTIAKVRSGLADEAKRAGFTVALQMIAARLYANHFDCWPVPGPAPEEAPQT